jgi:hypothetical protein
MDLAGEEQACLTSDGLTIIGLTTAHTGFVASTRSAVGMSDFGAVDATAFANVVATGTQTLSHPSISSDGLAFYYNVSGDPSASVNGIYEALRTTPTGVFAAGVLMNATIQGYQCVTGQSADRMTLFLQDANFRTWVLTRTSVLQQFVNPNAPAAPPFVPGFRIQPITGCTTLIGTCNSGCSNEKVCSY